MYDVQLNTFSKEQVEVFNFLFKYFFKNAFYSNMTSRYQNEHTVLHVFNLLQIKKKKKKKNVSVMDVGMDHSKRVWNR